MPLGSFDVKKLRKLSSAKSGDAPPEYTPGTNGGAPLPPTEAPFDLAAKLNALNLAGSPPFPTPDQCIAHLKFLHSLHGLRQDISTRVGLFDINGPPREDGQQGEESDPAPNYSDQAGIEPRAKVREKRWEVYVSRAVDRFSTWWYSQVPATSKGEPGGMLTCNSLLNDKNLEATVTQGIPIPALSNPDRLPPIGKLAKFTACPTPANKNRRAHGLACLPPESEELL